MSPENDMDIISERKPQALWPRVYVAGPISKGDLRENIARAVKASVELSKHAIAAFCPHLNAVPEANYPPAPLFSPQYETCLQTDLSFLSTCSVVLRLPGESAGADREVDFARSRGILVLTSVSDVVEYLRTERMGHPLKLRTHTQNGYFRDRESPAPVHPRHAPGAHAKIDQDSHGTRPRRHDRVDGRVHPSGRPEKAPLRGA